jgi:hypothetical protein
MQTDILKESPKILISENPLYLSTFRKAVRR